MDKPKEKDKTKKDIPQVSPRTTSKVPDPAEPSKDGTRHVVYSSSSQTSSQTPGSTSRISISRESFFQSPSDTSTPKSSKETIRTTRTIVTRTSTSSVKDLTSPTTSVRETVYSSKSSPRDTFYSTKPSEPTTESKTSFESRYSSKSSSKDSLYSSRTSLSETSSIRPKTSFIEATYSSRSPSGRTPLTQSSTGTKTSEEKTVRSSTVTPRETSKTLSPTLSTSKTLSVSSSSLNKSQLTSPRSPATTPKTPRRHLAEEATPSSTRQLKDRVSFFEQVWSGSSKSPSIESLHSTSVSDVSQHEWYTEYQSSSLSNSPRLDFVGSKTHFDSHIVQMRDEIAISEFIGKYQGLMHLMITTAMASVVMMNRNTERSIHLSSR
ncbi:hypothetical protein M8J77_017876 [Diaphorina citri]|nr:hypothetical protein M8J77_017876 [Diaphorina citri]